MRLKVIKKKPKAKKSNSKKSGYPTPTTKKGKYSKTGSSKSSKSSPKLPKPSTRNRGKSGGHTFEDVVINGSYERPVIVQFFATWCGPCKTLKPVMEGLSNKSGGKWVLAMVDVQTNQQLAAQFGVKSIPEVKMFSNGQIIASFSGAKPEYIVQNWLDSNLPTKKQSKKQNHPQDSPYSRVEDVLKKGDLESAKTNILDMLLKENPNSVLAKLLSALLSMGKNNAQAMQLINELSGEKKVRKGELGAIVKRVRDMIDMDVDEQDSSTPTHSPYHPLPDIANARIDLRSFDKNILAQLVQDMINDVRNKRGVSDLMEDTVLAAAANDQNDFQIKKDVLTHYQNDARRHTVKERVNVYGGGFRMVGENVQYQGVPVNQYGGRQQAITDTYVNTAKKIVQNWVDSPGHYKNLISPQFTYTGVAIGWNPSSNAFFATQVFGA